VRKAQLEAQFAQRNKIAPRIQGMPTPPMYNGAPMFYAQPPGQQFVYPGMVARGRFPPSPYGQPMPNYVVVNPGGRGQVKNGGGRGAMPSRRGMKQPQQQQLQTLVPIAQSVPVQVPVTPTEVPPQAFASLPPEEQKRVLGEKLYVLISKSQPTLAGKITGMILDSSYVDEILHLIEEPEALNEKIDEALKVLKDHNEKQKTQDE